MNFLSQPDKQKHFVGGALIAISCAAATHGNILWVGFAPAVVGILKEGADWASNAWNIYKGRPPQHGVEPLDAFATALPGFLLAAALYFWQL